MILNANKKETEKGKISLNIQCYFKNMLLKLLVSMKIQLIFLNSIHICLTFRFYLVASFVAKGVPFER